MGKREDFPVSLVIRASDQATGPMAAMSARMNAMSGPMARLGRAFAPFRDAEGVKRVAEGFSGVGTAVGNVGSQSAALAGKLLGVSAAAGVAIAALGARAIKAGDDVATLADRLDITVDEFVQLRYAAEVGDVSAEKFADAMDTLNKSMGQMKSGTGELRAFLLKVSPAFGQQIKAASGSVEALDLLAKAFERVEDPTKRAALAQVAFGGSGKDMIGFLSLGPKKIAEYRARQVELQGTQESFARGAAQLDNALRDVHYAFSGLGNTLFTAFGPAVTDAANAVSEFLARNRAGLARWAEETAGAFSKWIAGGGIARLGAMLRDFGAKALALVDRLGGWKSVLVGILAVMAGPLVASLGALVSGVVALGGALAATPIGWVVLGLGAVAGLVASLGGDVEQLGALFGPVFEPLGAQLSEVGSQLAEIWRLIAPALIPAMKALAVVVGVVLYGALNTVVYLLRGMVWLVQQVVDGIANALGSAKMLVTEGPAAWWAREAEKAGRSDFGKFLGFGGQRPQLQAPPSEVAGQTARSEAHVTVDFANVPRGVSVQAAPLSSAALDLGVGYSSAVP